MDWTVQAKTHYTRAVWSVCLLFLFWCWNTSWPASLYSLGESTLWGSNILWSLRLVGFSSSSTVELALLLLVRFCEDKSSHSTFGFHCIRLYAVPSPTSKLDQSTKWWLLEVVSVEELYTIWTFREYKPTQTYRSYLPIRICKQLLLLTREKSSQPLSTILESQRRLNIFKILSDMLYTPFYRGIYQL